METITSVVTAVKDKGDKYGIACGFNNWYNGFGKLPCKKGDRVEFTFEVNDKGFKNIGHLKVLSSSNFVPASERQEQSEKIQEMSKLKNQTNARVAALTNATNLCIARGEITLEHVIKEAHEMLEFLENDKVF